MRYWFDTEFDERGPDVPIQLISIGIVGEDGREYYAETQEYDRESAGEWLQQNVIPLLKGPVKYRGEIRDDLTQFCLGDCAKPEIWAYFASYDWVLLSQLYDTMRKLPAHFPHYVLDIKQYMKQLGVERSQLPPQRESGLHNALEDAKWNREAWEFLRRYERALGR